MTEYEVRPVSDVQIGPGPAWTPFVVESFDDEGHPHRTYFIGPLSQKRAEWYAEHMNANNKHPVIFPSD